MLAEVRSLLFVPGHKADWIQKALRSEADAVIIDLEDSVPPTEKRTARANARAAIESYDGSKLIFVRPNGLATLHFGEDLLEVTVSGLAGYLLPMLKTRDDIVAFDAVITAGEHRNDIPLGTVQIVASFETAESIENAHAILSGPRVSGAMAAAAKDADISRSVGFQWSKEGLETLYLRSRVVIAARANCLRMIVLGLWQDVRDLDGLTEFATANSALGYTGQVLIHPSHAPIVNDQYGLTSDRIDYYRRLIDAFEAGTARGDGAVSFEGEHIDLAHAENARDQLLRYDTNATAS